MTDQFLSEDLDYEREYSPSSVAKDFRESVAAYRGRSDALAQRLPWQRLAYGEAADEFVMLTGDLRRVRHIHLFIHGGYWQELSWRDALFPAAGFHADGFAYGAINYSLAPAVTLDQIIDQCRRAVLAVARAIYARDSAVAISLSGSSAGAHLAAILASTDWAIYDLPRNPVAAIILLSGIYDLRPLLRMSVNDGLGLDEDAARRASPLLLPITGHCPALVAWGEFETTSFKKQSLAFANHLRAAGNDVQAIEIAGRSHFDIVFDLSDRATSLGRHVFDLLQGL